MSWVYLPESVASNWESVSPSEEPELFVMSSGTPSPRPASWPGWKTRPWKRLLSGTTCPPSTANRGVESWIASLADSRAKTSASPDQGRDSMAPAPGSGPNMLASLAKWDPSSSSWRTSQLSLFGASTASSVIWPSSGSMRNGIAFPRPESEPHTSDDGSSSWPTPVARDWKGPGMDCQLPTVIGGIPNPTWVEWILGLPIGWTDFAALETESFLRWRRVHGSLFTKG